MCGLEITLEGARVGAIRGDEADPFSRGHVCPKAYGLADVHHDPDRQRAPLRRRGDRWEPIQWRDALDMAAEGLAAARARGGGRAVGLYLGNPSVHNLGLMVWGLPFMKALRTPNRFSATSLDQLPHMLASLVVLGHQLLLPVPDIDRTDLFVVMGANPLVSKGSLMSAGDTPGRLKAIRQRGGRVIVIDPARTLTAKAADKHLAIRPGADALLLMALIHALARKGALDGGRLAPRIEGLSALLEAAEDFSPAAVAGACGLRAAEIEGLARAIAGAQRPVIYGRLGTCTQSWGGLSAFLILALNAARGRLDEPGGAMFPKPAVDLRRLVGRGGFARRRSRVRGLPEFNGEYPAAAMAEEMLTEGEGQIRAMVTLAGNPVLSAPNGRRLDKALAGLDFMVSIDPYINETTRHAHLLLPPTFGLERDHYDLAFAALAVRDVARYSEAAWPRDPGARHDWEILLGLTARLKLGVRRGRLVERLPGPIARQLTPASLLDKLLRLGPHDLTLKALREAPSGVDLGALEPCLPEALGRRRVQLAPPLYLEDIGRLREALASGAFVPDTGLVLLGRRELASCNSWMHNSPRLTRGRRRCTLRMHPADAGDLKDGQRVVVRSNVGEVEVPLELTEDIRPGVVSLPHGWGHDRPGARLTHAATRPGASINDLTDDQALDPLSGNAAFTATRVMVEAAAASEAAK